MMKYCTLIILFVLCSCGNKEDIILPKAAETVVKKMDDLSPIYIFFRIKGKDTLAEVNRKNSIISTNWIVNIDKRLPLSLVIPEVIKLQKKKREEKAHKNEKAENYYSYADTIGKNLAFLSFTNVFYKMEKPNTSLLILITKDNQIAINNSYVKKEDLQAYLDKMPSNQSSRYTFGFDKNLSFGLYIQNKIWIRSLKLPFEAFDIEKEEFIY